MKRTFTITISGTIFHIEEDAYELLQNYLVNLKHHFGEDEEGREILSDIEARIAEIFADKASDNKNVITIEMVEQIINTMGTPEDFAEETGEEDQIIAGSSAKRKRRLYRDPDHRVFGGVCAGLGAYFSMDPVILRIIFAVLFFVTTGGIILAYLVLWIAVPKARTTAQKLEMQGQEANVKNIERSIREEVKEVKESYKKFKESDTYTKGKKSIEGAGEVTYNIFRLLLKITVIIIGIVLIISGFFGLVGMISSLILGHSIVHNWPLVWSPEIHFPDVFQYFVGSETVTLGIIIVGLLAAVPLLAMLYVGSKIVFRYKSNNTAIGLSMLGVWLIALMALAVVSVSEVGNFKNKSSIVTSNTVQCNDCQTLYLSLAENKYESYTELDWDINNFKVFMVNGEEIMVGKPKLDVERSSGKSFIITVKKSSRGRSRDGARDQAEDIIYNYEQKDSIICFEPYFFLSEDQKWRDQKVQITVKVPEGKAIFLDDNMTDIIYDIENVSNTWDNDMVGKYWQMTSNGLTMKELPKDSVETKINILNHN